MAHKPSPRAMKEFMASHTALLRIGSYEQLKAKMQPNGDGPLGSGGLEMPSYMINAVTDDKIGFTAYLEVDSLPVEGDEGVIYIFNSTPYIYHADTNEWESLGADGTTWEGPYPTVEDIPTPYALYNTYIVGIASPYTLYLPREQEDGTVKLIEIGGTSNAGSSIYRVVLKNEQLINEYDPKVAPITIGDEEVENIYNLTTEIDSATFKSDVKEKDLIAFYKKGEGEELILIGYGQFISSTEDSFETTIIESIYEFTPKDVKDIWDSVIIDSDESI